MSEAAKGLLSSVPPPQSFGRYVLHAPIARGGMATVHIARLVGAEGFSRLVAAKRPHPQFSEDPDFVTMFHDEARIASRIHHPNVVPVLDVVLEGHEVIIVQEYVHGVPLDRLFKAALVSEDTQIPVGIVVAIISAVLAGLHAAHETKDDMGEPLSIVHRDVSPENVMVSVDGIPRLLDFGIAKARSSSHVTREGFFKGKIAYMAPEQLRAEDVTRAADIYATGVLLWELLAHKRLHAGRQEAELFNAVLTGALPTLTAALEGTRAWISPERWEQIRRIEPIVSRALATRPQARFATADEMLHALQGAAPCASTSEIVQWVKTTGAEYLERRQSLLMSSEESWRSHSKIASAAPASGPVSGPVSAPVESVMKLVTARRETTDEREGLGTPLYPTAMSAAPPETIAKSRRAQLIPWIAAAALLWVVGILLGVIVVRRSDGEPVEARAAAAVAAPPPALELPATPASAATPMPAPTSSDPVALPQKASRPPAYTAAPQARFVPAPKAPPPQAPHPPAPAPPPHAAAQASAPPPAAPAPSAKPDCDPPFYFEGSKKIYKANCL